MTCPSQVRMRLYAKDQEINFHQATNGPVLAPLARFL